MTTATPTVSRSIEIAADPSSVYALVTDLAVLAELAEETDSMTWKKGHSAVPGAVFSGANSNGTKKWNTRCTITDAVPGRMFAFEVDMPLPFTAVARWQYDIAVTDGGCRVTESTWDRRSAAFAAVAGFATGVKDRTAASREHIAITLQRLKVRAESTG